MFMPKSRFNNGLKYVFARIDVFSKNADMHDTVERQRTNNDDKNIWKYI